MTVSLVTTATKTRGRFSALARPGTVAAATLLAMLIAAALLAPWISPFEPNASVLADAFQWPSAAHWLGTDQLGRDILSRLLFGGRVSLFGVGQVMVIYLVAGLVLGLVAGYLGGVVDAAVVWLSDLSFALPQIIVILTVLAIFANDGSAAMMALGILGAPGLAVFVRGATRSVKAELYIAAARVSGLRTPQILVRHILPRIAAPVIVQASIFAGTALLFQTGLDFLALGTQPPTASWGAMVAEASVYLGTDIWMVMPPGVVIVLAIVAFGLIGDGLNDHRAAETSGSSRRPRAARRRGAPAGTVPISAAGSAIERRRSAATDADGAVLSVRDLSVGTSDRTPIVQNVTFDLRPGECLGIVGESGSGKTMTARAIVGLLPDGVEVSSGSATFEGHDLASLSAREFAQVRGSGIGMIFQEPIPSLDPSFTVGAQLAEVVRTHGTARGRVAVRSMVLELLERVRIPDPAAVARVFPHQMSGGMAQRVAIAAALAGRPRVLIADEPTTALDVTVQAEILELLRELRRNEGLAVILVSHDWGVIADSCDSALVMYAGQVVEEADIASIFAQPKHPYSYGLMASSPEHAAPRAMLRAIPGTVPAVGDWPRGCHFAARCPFATADCSRARIPLAEVSPAHWSRCIHPDSVPSTVRIAR
jgi:peptide/nickel transport system permease protein